MPPPDGSHRWGQVAQSYRHDVRISDADIKVQGREAESRGASIIAPPNQCGSIHRLTMEKPRNGQFCHLAWADLFNHRMPLESIEHIPPAGAGEQYYAMPGRASHGRIT